MTMWNRSHLFSIRLHAVYQSRFLAHSADCGRPDPGAQARDHLARTAATWWLGSGETPARACSGENDNACPFGGNGGSELMKRGLWLSLLLCLGIAAPAQPKPDLSEKLGATIAARGPAVYRFETLECPWRTARGITASGQLRPARLAGDPAARRQRRHAPAAGARRGRRVATRRRAWTKGAGAPQRQGHGVAKCHPAVGRAPGPTAGHAARLSCLCRHGPRSVAAGCP